MDRSMEKGDESLPLIGRLGNMERREFLTKAAAAGAVAWATPVILSRPAYAVEDGEGSPTCRPTIGRACVVHSCGAGDPTFPGIQLTVSDCPCDDGDPPQSPTVCARIDNLQSVIPLGPTLQAYANASACNPNDDDDVILASTATPGAGTWQCIDPSQPILIAPVRTDPDDSVPAFPLLAAASVIRFRLAVWAGNCPPNVPGVGLTYNCQTYDVMMTVVTVLGAVTVQACVIEEFGPGDTESLCTTGATSPCGSCA